MSTVWQNGFDGGNKWRAGTRETEVGLNGWCEGNNFEPILFPHDMIQDIYKLHWNIIHKSIGVP